jgi:Zinc finger, C2H2 type/Zinc-finger of C2H2 type
MEKRNNAKRIKSKKMSSELSSTIVISTKNEVELEKQLITNNESSRPKRETKPKFATETKTGKKYKTSKRIVCVLCRENKCFANTKTYHQHVRKVHRKQKKIPKDLQKKIIVCEICSATLKSEAYFKRHMETRHSKKQKIYSCDNCGRSFNQKDYLRIHMDRHRIHQILTCTVCQKSYISKHTFRRHLKMVSLIES